MSHYFISYIASSLLLLGGFPYALSTVVKPLKIELPHSLVHVVICWNIPMHFWLKTCTYEHPNYSCNSYIFKILLLIILKILYVFI